MLPQQPEVERGVEMRWWQDLASDIVRSVAERVSGVDDFVRLCAVCRPWSEALTGFRPPLLGQFPWLVPTAKLTSDDDDDEREEVVVALPMYSPNNHRVSTFPVPRGGGRGFPRVVGCHRGWLVTVDDYWLDFDIFNPVTGDRASLPRFYTHKRVKKNVSDIVFKKVALSSTPPSSSSSSYWGGSSSSSEVVAAAVIYCIEPRNAYGQNAYGIAFAEVGGRTWSGHIRLPFLVTDVIYFRGSFFVVNIEGRYQIIEPPSGARPPRMAVALQFHPTFWWGSYFTFVSSPSSGHLLAVGARSATRLEFLVIKYNPPPSPHPWVQVSDLGDEALFLGGGYAMLLPVAEAGGSSRTRRNCIYYIYGSDHDGFVCEFDAEKGVFRDPLLEQRSFMKNSSCWPLIKQSCWFLPSLS